MNDAGTMYANAKALHELLQESRAENEKLREQGERLFDKTLELGTENTQLRELVRDLYPFALGRAAKPWLAVRRDRMRELGVEV